MNMNSSPITLLVCALGGEGGGVLAEWLMDVARAAGHHAQATSIPGVAQRTGATTYYLEFSPAPGGLKPVFGLSPVPGQLDLLVSSELLEAARQATAGMASPQRTRIISSTARLLTTAERMVPGDGRADAAQLVEQLRQNAKDHWLLDMAALARDAGTVVSAVLLGAVAGSGVLPFARAQFEAAIQAGGRGAQASLRGFAAAYEQAERLRSQGAVVQQALQPPATLPAAAPSLPPALAQRFPPAVHAMLALGHARVREYQDDAYAALYVQRLERVLQAEAQADPYASHSHATTREMARWLALWMAFDDIVRVAQLKRRAARLQRIAVEAGVAEGDVLKVFEHFKPGVPEVAGLLPARLASALRRWDARRQQRGLPPFSLALTLGTHTVHGALGLALLSAAQPLRRRGERFAQEQALIEQWLAGVVQGTARHWALGHELALCGRLIKGYGSTNERGKHLLLHVLGQLLDKAPFASDAARAVAVADARTAALKDDAGRELDAALLRHGAAPPPLREQPIRFVRKRPASP